MNSLWYPYCQMKTAKPPIEISKGQGPYLITSTGEKLLDGISSWWCTIHGYNHKKLNKALKKQIDTLSHVMLGGLTHSPAIELSKKLVSITPQSLNHVFYSDSGSVGMEVAMKLAIQYWKNKNHPNKCKFVSLKGAYHGDTSGVMSIGDVDDGMHTIFKNYLPQQFFLQKPTSAYIENKQQLEYELHEMETLFKENNDQISAFVVEPIMQGAGGFNLYSPSYLNEAYKLCKKYNILLIFDEVATGFGRTGKLFATNHTSISPDILVLGKALTGGLLGHAATLTTSKIFNAFYDNDESKCFMHGPTFMGNPLACAASLKSIEVFENENYLEKIQKIETILKKEFQHFKNKHIKDIRILGAMAAIEVNDSKCLASVQEFATKNGVWLRPFDNILYTTPPYIIKPKELKKITTTMKNFFIQL